MILITGCTGYIGSRLARTLLTTGKRVRGLVLPHERERAAKLEVLGMEIWPGDLLKPDTLEGIMQGITCWYHMAGLHSASLQRMEQVYVQGARHLLQSWEYSAQEDQKKASVASSLQACVVASNAAVYSSEYGDYWQKEDEAVTEPLHPFGEITLAMEEVFRQAYLTAHFPVILLRIAQVYGPGEYNPVKAMMAGRVKLLGDGRNWNSYIHIDDLITMLRTAPTGLKIGDTYNVVDDLPVRQNTFYQYLATLLDRPAPDWYSPEEMPDRLRLSLHGLRALSLRLTNEKLKKQLAITWQYPTYVEGLHQLISQELHLF